MPESEPESSELPDASEDSFEERWQELTSSQKKVVQAWLMAPTKKAAAEEVGLSPATVYEWPEEVWEVGDLLLDKRMDGMERGLSALSPAAIDALERALDPDADTSREEAKTARYLVNALRGKPTQRQEVDLDTGGIDLDEKAEDELDEMLAHLGDGDGESDGE
jgi:hypothetical protein